MSRLEKSLVLAASMMLTHGTTALAQEEAASETPVAPAGPVAEDVPVSQDLTAVIALQGQPCGKVVSSATTGEDAYLATCQDANRYRIFVNAEGRVIVAKVE